MLETDKVREFYDRFVSNFVLDILPEREIEEILKEARRVLKEGGLIA